MGLVDRVKVNELGVGDVVLHDSRWVRVLRMEDGRVFGTDSEEIEGKIEYGHGPWPTIQRIPGPVLEALAQGVASGVQEVVQPRKVVMSSQDKDYTTYCEEDSEGV